MQIPKEIVRLWRSSPSNRGCEEMMPGLHPDILTRGRNVWKSLPLEGTEMREGWRDGERERIVHYSYTQAVSDISCEDLRVRTWSRCFLEHRFIRCSKTSSLFHDVHHENFLDVRNNSSILVLDCRLHSIPELFFKKILMVTAWWFHFAESLSGDKSKAFLILLPVSFISSPIFILFPDSMSQHHTELAMIQQYPSSGVRTTQH